MRAMQLQKAKTPLKAVDCPIPTPGDNDVLIKVSACGVCRTDLHIVDGELSEPKLPLIPGHEIIGIVEQKGALVHNLAIGQRVGIPWLGKTCGHCFYCTHGQENLCDKPLFTGYTRDGGYAQYTVADARFAFLIPDAFSDAEAAPLMCAGLIGWRTYRMVGDAENIGIYGFGAAAHIIAQIAICQGRKVYAFTRDGDEEGQEFARALGATWAGGSSQAPPEPLDAAMIFAPVGALVPESLSHVRKGAVVVCGGIHMSDIPQFPYSLLWGERSIRSVANLTRQDGHDFFQALQGCKVKTQVSTYPLADANAAIADLHQGRLNGAAVLLCNH